MGLIANIITDPLGLSGLDPVRQRQRRQWKVANDLLQPAANALADGDTEMATATALVGLLALKLSDS